MNGIQGIRTSTYTPQTKETAALKQFQPFESASTGKIDLTNAQHDDQDSVLSKNEQNFFEQLYPDSTQEIRSYQTYRRDGERMMATMGSMVDRKG
ncbi:MAG TPA: hypothetical protein VMU30_02125 [Bacteroidota bacterium]|nr:hypothetical protein [Bacteroidota bacterium]